MKDTISEPILGKLFPYVSIDECTLRNSPRKTRYLAAREIPGALRQRYYQEI